MSELRIYDENAPHRALSVIHDFDGIRAALAGIGAVAAVREHVYSVSVSMDKHIHVVK